MDKQATTDISFTHASLKMMLRALTKYGEKKIFGSPVEQEIYKELQWQLRTALCELQFKDD